MTRGQNAMLRKERKTDIGSVGGEGGRKLVGHICGRVEEDGGSREGMEKVTGTSGSGLDVNKEEDLVMGDRYGRLRGGASNLRLVRRRGPIDPGIDLTDYEIIHKYFVAACIVSSDGEHPS